MQNKMVEESKERLNILLEMGLWDEVIKAFEKMERPAYQNQRFCLVCVALTLHLMKCQSSKPLKRSLKRITIVLFITEF